MECCQFKDYLQSQPIPDPSDPSTWRVPLRARDGTLRAYALIDAADVLLAARYRWHLAVAGYAARRNRDRGRGTLLLHRELLGLPRVSDGREVDHINRDRLDNRRANLRVLPRGQGSQNRRAYGRSEYRGVSWASNIRAWRAAARKDARSVYLGSYDIELDAARAAARFRAEHYPCTVEDPALLDGPPPVRRGRS
jgi:hypothetical protein